MKAPEGYGISKKEAAAMEVVQTRALSKVYGKKRAVDELSMTVHEGDIYGFIGKNGAGDRVIIRPS